MYRGDGALSDGMECLLEEMLDEAERPLTFVPSCFLLTNHH